MEISHVLEILGGVRELAKQARVVRSETIDDRRVREIENLISALRIIYFSPKGVISLLRIISEGGYPTREQVELILPGFNDAETMVFRSRVLLDPDFDRNNRTLTLRAQRVLREIAYGKGGVRTKIQELLNWSLTNEEPISREQALYLIEEIKNLNCAIEEAEEALVSAITR